MSEPSNEVRFINQGITFVGGLQRGIEGTIALSQATRTAEVGPWRACS
jgi:hypothetical protein